MKYWFRIFLFLFGFLPAVLWAQSPKSKRIVVDQVTGQPIPFVHVKAVGTGQVGTTTDVLGGFSIDRFQQAVSLIFSHVGYEKLEITLRTLESLSTIELKPLVMELQEFEFSAGENPALPIVRQAIQNRSINNPENLESYRYSSYNKVLVTLDGLSEDPLEDNSSLKFLEGGHLFMSESYSEVKFKKPGKRNETVKATKLSGIENPIFAAVSTTFQPFSVYTDHIKILEIPFVNPISPDGMRKYDYFLEDSLQTESGKSYLISYQPKEGKSYHLGKGLVYISSNRFALENFLLKPADESGQIFFEIQQRNRFDGGHWFPEQLNSFYLFKELDVNGRTGKLVNQTFLSEVGINDLDPKEKISAIDITYDIRKDYEWGNLRKDTLSTREVLTYDRFERLDPKTKRLLNNGANIFAYLSTGRLKLGVVDLIPNRLLRFNRYERLGLGLGLSTNETLSNFFRVGGYVRYGTRDQAWKYGANADFFLNPEQDTRLQLSYSEDIHEPGRSMMEYGRTFGTAGQYFRNFLADRMDQVQRYGLQFSGMPIKGFRYKLLASVENRFQSLDYAQTAPDVYARETTATEAGVELNYTGGQSITRIGNDLLALTLSYPVVGLRMTKAIPALFQGDQDFINTEFRFIHQWSTGNSLHQFNMSAQGIWGSDLPISYLNTGMGVRTPASGQFDLPVSFSGYLQTMQLYEFLSDRSVYVSYAHLTGPLFTKRSKSVVFAPQVKFHQSFAIGSLTNPERYNFVNISTMERGYLESGLEFANLIKFTSGFQAQGWGFGVFYRYGPYALPEMKDNLRFTLSLTAGF